MDEKIDSTSHLLVYPDFLLQSLLLCSIMAFLRAGAPHDNGDALLRTLISDLSPYRAIRLKLIRES